MLKDNIIHSSSVARQSTSNEFEEAFYSTRFQFSLRHLAFTGNDLLENIKDALYKSLQICNLAGVNSQYHFKQIYVFDEDSRTMDIDWLMSKNGFNLMVMQIESLNTKKALW